MTTGTVLLDLKRNRYFGVGQNETRALFTLARNWDGAAAPTRTAITPMLEDEAVPIADRLVRTGLLCNEAPSARSLHPATIDLDTELASVGYEIVATARVKVAHLPVFLRSCYWAARAVRSRKLYDIVAEVDCRKRDSSGPFDTQRAIELVCVFRKLRPYAFAAKNQCLFHALALVRFLSHYQVFPTWVIGVRLRPWAAHSWVQHENLILDASPEQVCEYAPILAV